MSNLYQRSRQAGLNPNYWYAVARSKALPRGAMKEAIFWGRSLALFRSSEGTVGALANRCAHRGIKLTLGTVSFDRVVCAYHGWEFNATGQAVRIPHKRSGRAVPELCVKSYPVRERYGLVWIFPGQRERAVDTPLPLFPEVEGPRPWASVNFDFIWRAHFSIIIENLLDLTHAYLHRRSRAFENVVVAEMEADANRVAAMYDASIGNGRVLGRFVNRRRINTSRIATYFEYPYQRASIDDKIKHWCFLTPIDARRTQLFFTIVVDFDTLRVPHTSLRLPHWAAQSFLDVAKQVMIGPLLDEDRVVVEAEQEAVDTFPAESFDELNPVTRRVQEVIVRNWDFDASRSEQFGQRAVADRSVEI